MTKLEDRMVAANTLVPCPKWCAGEHDIDTIDNSGLHKLTTAELDVLMDDDLPLTIGLTQAFGGDGDGAVHDPILIQVGAHFVTVDGCLEIARALIYAATLAGGSI